MPFLLRHALLGIAVFALQWLLLGRLTLWDAYPDAVLLYVAWLGLRHGRQVGALAGFYRILKPHLLAAYRHYLVATHHLDELGDRCDRVVHLEAGRVAYDGDAAGWLATG